jgi:hypothetical protein
MRILIRFLVQQVNFLSLKEEHKPCYIKHKLWCCGLHKSRAPAINSQAPERNITLTLMLN